MTPRHWRLWQILRGAFRPGPGPFDLAEAQRQREEAERELESVRARWPAVDAAAAANALPTRHPDELAYLIERAFERRGI